MGLSLSVTGSGRPWHALATGLQLGAEIGRDDQNDLTKEAHMATAAQLDARALDRELRHGHLDAQEVANSKSGELNTWQTLKWGTVNK